MKNLVQLSKEEINSFIIGSEGWDLTDNKLCKNYSFKDFKAAFSFMTQLATVAEEINHHPTWENSYNKVSIKLFTHHTGTITEGDLVLARAADKFASNLTNTNVKL